SSRACWVTAAATRRTTSPTDYSRAPATPGPRSGGTGRCRGASRAGTTRGSPGGGATSRYDGPPGDAPTSSTTSSWGLVTSRCWPRRAGAPRQEDLVAAFPEWHTERVDSCGRRARPGLVALIRGTNRSTPERWAPGSSVLTPDTQGPS